MKLTVSFFMKFFVSFIWTFILIQMVSYVTSSMLGYEYNFNTATIIAVIASLFIWLVVFAMPQDNTTAEHHEHH